jgi:hypothetical protein
MTTEKKTCATFRKDAEDIGRNLVGRGQRLLGDTKKTFAATLKRLQPARAQPKPKA